MTELSINIGIPEWIIHVIVIVLILSPALTALLFSQTKASVIMFAALDKKIPYWWYYIIAPMFVFSILALSILLPFWFLKLLWLLV